MDCRNLGVVELLLAFEKKELTSIELVRKYREAYELDLKSEKPINGYIEFFEDAEAMAEKADLERSLGTTKKLLGIPFAVKDNISMRGRKLSCASAILQGYLAPYTATVVEKLIAEGAIPIGRTNMDEFAMGSSCEYSFYGATRNPLSKDRTAGGSSGGSAAVMASGMAAFSLGSETGGSVRLPASFCGLYGYKPSYGAFSRYGLVAFGSSFDQIGVFTRKPEDLALITSIAAGKDPLDETSEEYNLSKSPKVEACDFSKHSFAIPKQFLGDAVNPEVASVFESAKSFLLSKGAKVDEVDLPILESCIAIYYILAPAEASSNLSRFDGIRYGARKDPGKGLNQMYTSTRTEGFGKEVQRRILIGNYVLSSGYYDAYYKKAQDVRTLLRKEMAELFSKYDMLLSPTCTDSAFLLGSKTEDPLAMYLNDLCTTFANLASVPAISLPFGKTKDGLPVGIQLACAKGNDELLFRSALAFNSRGEK